MARERIIYPNNPETLTWENYVSEYPICGTHSRCSEKQMLDDEINEIKNKIFGLVGATPKDICNENDDPFECIMDKLNILLNDYKFLVKRKWKLNLIEQYEEVFDEGVQKKLNGTIDKDTNKLWKPYVWICNASPENEIQCDIEIEDAQQMIDMFTRKLTMYVTATPSNCYSDNEECQSFDNVFFEVRDLLDSDDGFEHYWWDIFNWTFIKENFNEDSYNN